MLSKSCRQLLNAIEAYFKTALNLSCFGMESRKPTLQDFPLLVLDFGELDPYSHIWNEIFHDSHPRESRALMGYLDRYFSSAWEGIECIEIAAGVSQIGGPNFHAPA